MYQTDCLTSEEITDLLKVLQQGDIDIEYTDKLKNTDEYILSQSEIDKIVQEYIDKKRDQRQPDLIKCITLYRENNPEYIDYIGPCLSQPDIDMIVTTITTLQYFSSNNYENGYKDGVEQTKKELRPIATLFNSKIF